MDVFGGQWKDHHLKMAEKWDALVGPEDVVLCPGDLSWAMRLDEAKEDLAWIGSRRAKQIVLGRGNHDYWWSGISKVRAALPERCVALQNDAIDLGDVVVCGSRCWTVPGASDFSAADRKIYEREIHRLQLSLEHGKKMAQGRPLIAAIHYPPFTSRKQSTAYSDLLEKYEVNICIYGHLHGAQAHAKAVQGQKNGITYRLVSADATDFSPVKIWPY